MMRAGLLLLCLWAGGALAQTVDVRPQGRPVVDSVAPLRPVSRPVIEQVSVTIARPQVRPTGLVPPPPPQPTLDNRPSVRPYTRPDLARGAATQPQRRAEAGLFAFSPTAVRLSLRPTERPAKITQRAVEQRIARQRGALCGDPAIQGEPIGRINGRGRCGVDNAVRVRSVAGVTLRPSPTIDCRTAGALKAWVAQTAKPAVGSSGGGIASLRIVSHYACRNRNSARSGRLSEHAFGRAVDIAGIGLKSGQEITVLTDWNRGAAGEALRKMWRGACGPFGTVLGPNSNAAHRDHFHFDTARYRSGSYCR